MNAGRGGFKSKDTDTSVSRNRGRFRGKSRGTFIGRNEGKFSSRKRGSFSSKCKTFNVTNKGLLDNSNTGSYSGRNPNRTNVMYSPNNCKTNCFTEQLLEKDVGITEYINQGEGFSAVFKARFSDFHVNEIDLEYEVAKLTNTSVPTEFKLEKQMEQEVPSTSPSDSISQKVWDELKILNLPSMTRDIVKLDVTGSDKNFRSGIHETVKKYFNRTIIANTVNENDKKFIVFKQFNIENVHDIVHRTRWPKDIGEYVHFIVYKENIDTLEAAMKISDCLHMKVSNFNYSGVKDRRAKTTQWFSVRKVAPWKILKKTKNLRCVHIGNFKFKDQPLKLGQLIGNKFQLALRNVSVSDEVIEQSMTFLQQNGFINFYGLQRFGNDKEVPTYEIGLQLLLGNFKKACELILACKKNDNPKTDTTRAKKVYKDTGDAVKASSCFEYNDNKCVESKLLRGLANSNANDYVNALENIPRNMRLLYMHSFQALIWNKITSQRIKKFGLNVMVGDLVWCDDKDKLNAVVDDNVEDLGENLDTPEEDIGKKKKSVKILTNEDLKFYTIYDIVLPLPGNDVIYPENVIKNWYKEMLEEYGLNLEMPKQRVITYNLGGTYRNIIAKVNNFNWKILRYSDPNADLIASDLDIMKNKETPTNIPGGRFKALILDFHLPSSSYATMVVREILKMDTSKEVQAKLNDYHHSQETHTVEENHPESLFSDPKKLEQLKKDIYCSSDTEGKRTLDDDDDDEDKVKKIKVE